MIQKHKSGRINSMKRYRKREHTDLSNSLDSTYCSSKLNSRDKLKSKTQGKHPSLEPRAQRCMKQQLLEVERKPSWILPIHLQLIRSDDIESPRA